MRGAAAAALLAATVAAGACGSDDARPPSSPGVVRVTLDVPSAGPANPDAGTAAGHRAELVAHADGPRLEIGGTVAPSTATLRVRAPATVSARAAVAADGRLRIVIEALPRGTTRVIVEARAADAAPWRRAVVVRR